MQHLRQTLQANNKFRLWTSIALAGLTVLMVLGTWDLSLYSQQWIHLAAFALGSGSFYALYLFIKGRKVENHEVWAKAISDPEEVVWVYPLVTDNMPYGVKVFSWSRMQICKSDGEIVQFSFPQKKAEELMDEMRELFPKASFGHSIDKEQLFTADPNLLRRE